MDGRVVVKRSRIEGKGVFAGRDFARGETVLEWDTSHGLNGKELDLLPESEKKYVSLAEGKCVLMQPPERFVNHSCEANTEVRGFRDVAKRGIRKGEEITADYAEGGVPGFTMKCNCGSAKCRGTVKT